MERNWITLVKGLLGGGTSFLGAAVSTMQHVESWLRLASLLAGLSVATLTCVSLWRGNRVAVLKEEVEQLLLCDVCRKGLTPRNCPIPKAKRSQDCRLNQG